MQLISVKSNGIATKYSVCFVRYEQVTSGKVPDLCLTSERSLLPLPALARARDRESLGCNAGAPLARLPRSAQPWRGPPGARRATSQRAQTNMAHPTLPGRIRVGHSRLERPAREQTASSDHISSRIISATHNVSTSLLRRWLSPLLNAGRDIQQC
jgi:hypothetical protein